MKQFIQTASAHLERGINLIIAPEGTSHATEDSPGQLKSGAFFLAASMPKEPLIVPVAVANFDRRLNRSVLKAQVLPSFRMSERVSNTSDESEMNQFLVDLRHEFKTAIAGLS